MTPARIASVPNQPRTPVKCFRCPEGLWSDAMATAIARNEVLSEEIRKFLEQYVKGAT